MKKIKRVKCFSVSRKHFTKKEKSQYQKALSLKKTCVLTCSGKRPIWQRLKVVLFPYLIRSKELAVAYAEAKVEKELSEARKIAEQAAEVAAKKDLIRQKCVKEFGTVIDDIFVDDGLPPCAKALKLAKLIEENPRVVARLERTEKIIEKFSLDDNHLKLTD